MSKPRNGTRPLSALLAERQQLDEQIVRRLAEREAALNAIRGLIEQHAVTPQELFPGLPAGSPTKPRRESVRASIARLPIKYRHPTTLETWTGTGQRPLWLRKAIAAGAQLEDFAVHLQG